MANVGLGVTIGSHSLRGVQLRKKGDKYVVQRLFADRLDDTTRPVAGRALSARGFKGAAATVGLTGRDVIIRYTQVPPVPDWRLRTLMRFEVEEVGQQSGGDVSADYRALALPDPEGTRDEETILVALARNKYLTELIRSLASGGLKLAGGVPNSVALFNAFAANATYTEDETSLLVNIGARNLDIAIQRGGDLIFARNATPGGAAYTEAIQQAFNTSEKKAEQMKKAKGNVTPKGQATYPDPTSEKVANAIMGVAGQMASLIQSTLMIARAQTRLPDLKVDRVQLSGGGASLKGLDLYLKQALDIPVERFNPFVLCDTSGLHEDELALIEEAPHEFTVAVGLAQNAVAPEAMNLSVLPTAMRRARDFATKGVWAALAAVVMLGVLVLLHQGRSEASGAFASKTSRIKKLSKDASREDQELRKVLKTAQETEVKHQLLAELTGPGVLLTQVLAEIEANATPYIYIDEVKLTVTRPTNTFPYYKPKKKRNASGFERASRSRYHLREASVRLKARISSGQKASEIATPFIEACLANKRGLVVETRGQVKSGGARGQDGSFELEFFPGVTLQASGEKASPTTLRSVRLDDQEEPRFFIGYRSDGVEVKLAIEDVKRKQADDLIKELGGTPPERGSSRKKRRN